jgi:hypothetical protein
MELIAEGELEQLKRALKIERDRGDVLERDKTSLKETVLKLEAGLAMADAIVDKILNRAIRGY